MMDFEEKNRLDNLLIVAILAWAFLATAILKGCME